MTYLLKYYTLELSYHITPSHVTHSPFGIISLGVDAVLHNAQETMHQNTTVEYIGFFNINQLQYDRIASSTEVYLQQ